MITTLDPSNFTEFATRATNCASHTAVDVATTTAVDEATRNTIYSIILAVIGPLTSTTCLATRNAIWDAVDPILR